MTMVFKRKTWDKKTACIVIPAFQEQAGIANTVKGAKQYVETVVVVDDGSRDQTTVAAEAAGAVALRHDRNLGKGVALNTGFTYAQQRGHHLTITIDADGQHDTADIPRFLEAYERTGIPVLLGNRLAFPKDLPFVRRWINRMVSAYLSRLMGQYLPDTQCGFRLYRTDMIPFVSAISKRYAAESEILLRVAARGIRMDSVPIRTIRGSERSMLHPVRDGIRFFWMLWSYKVHGRRRPAQSKPAAFP